MYTYIKYHGNKILVSHIHTNSNSKQNEVSKIQNKVPMHLASVAIPTVAIKVGHVCGTNSRTVNQHKL